jgi:cyclopropane-fatty-acyl-phospholipid synthase
MSALVGASPAAIRHHYDVGNDFFATWLDESMTYSCALWTAEDKDLHSAQMRKLDYHIDRARAFGVERVLGIGCGWGSALERLVKVHGVGHAVGLTLSDAQAQWIARRELRSVDVRVESWQHHVPSAPYDAIVCIGALEHFARPDETSEQRIAVYRHFFERCRDFLKQGSWISIQTIAFGLGEYRPNTPLAEIFPESCLPRLSELAAAYDRVFELELITNDRADYVRTLESWISNMESNWSAVVAHPGGEARAERYKRYLQFVAMGFRAGFFDLLRLSLKALPKRERRR